MLCRSGHRIAGGLVWKLTMKNLRGEGCHEELSFGGSLGISLQREACWLKRRVVEWGCRLIGICGTLDLSERDKDTLYISYLHGVTEGSPSHAYLTK